MATVGPSLARRMIVNLIIAQLAGFVVGASATVALELANIAFYELSLDELAMPRVTRYVIDSLQRRPDGSLKIEPNEKLRREINRSPDLKYAVFYGSQAPVDGSSPEVVSTLIRIGALRIKLGHLHFNLPEDTENRLLGFFQPVTTDFGVLHAAVYRHKFQWVDPFFYILEIMQPLSAYVVSVILFSIGSTWVIVRRGLIPFREAANKVARVDLESAEPNLFPGPAPMEVAPFIDAIEAALERVRASASRLRRYAANAAHELRTPLATMRMRLDNAADSTLKNELLSDSSQLGVIVEQMLIATRLFEGHVSRSEDVDLVQVAKGVISNFVLLGIRFDKTVRYEGVDSGLAVLGNSRAIECVLANLVDNALRAEPAGGSVIVRVSDEATISVIDHGRGVAPADRQAIFEPFWRKREEAAGYGLGLAIAKDLMDNLGGRIWVEETPGGGATFTLAFANKRLNSVRQA
ncbi:MAG: HAMP domain-containing histidine kinase [Methylocystis sp.]|nr:HAMP domain-containing histidine kinase [Methylocystis sp.]